jgi:branched-chain amino acid transport system permease protein
LALINSVLTFIFITIVSVTGVYILTGLTGMFSLGQASFMALGSYVSAIMVTKVGVPFIPACIIAIVVAVLIGFVVGLPTVRLRRDYISLVTLGFGEAITSLLNQFTKITGGASGFTGIPKITNVWIAGGSAIVCVALAAFFKNSKYGRQCIAVRNDELAAKSMGINAPRVKMIAFLTSVAVTAFSGCLYAFFTTYVDPTLFGWKKSAEWIIMVFFGGSNSLTGSILGTFLLSGLPEVMRALAEYRSVVYAVLVLLIINFKPSGLLGEWEFTLKNIKALFHHRKSNDIDGNYTDSSKEITNDGTTRS